jgi:hypothetical protein
MTGQVVVV